MSEKKPIIRGGRLKCLNSEFDFIMAIKKGYDGSIHASSSAVASDMKIRGHKKEDVFAARFNGKVIKGRQKPDVVKESDRVSVKGAAENIQLYLSKLKPSEDFYGVNSPLYKFHLAGAEHRKFKYENNNYEDW